MQLSPYFNLGKQLELIPIFHSSVNFVPHSLPCSQKAGAFFFLRGYEFYIFALKTGSEPNDHLSSILHNMGIQCM